MSTVITPSTVKDSLKRCNLGLQGLAASLSSIEAAIGEYVSTDALHGVAYSSHKKYFQRKHKEIIREKKKLIKSLIDLNQQHIRHVDYHLGKTPHFDQVQIHEAIRSLQRLVAMAENVGIGTLELRQELAFWEKKEIVYAIFL
jgi:hypothetical protein